MVVYDKSRQNHENNHSYSRYNLCKLGLQAVKSTSTAIKRGHK